MKKYLLAAAVGLSVVLGAVAAYSTPPESPPGQGDCSHGNSGQTCVPDPQPTHGQDCLEHGNEGGVNEDHCLTTTGTTSVPPTTTTTSVTPTESVSTTTTTVVTSTVPTGTTTTTVPTQTPQPTTTTTTQTPLVTSSGPTGKDTKTATLTGSGTSEKGTAFTGVEDVVPMGAAVLVMLTVGSGLLWRGGKHD